MNGGGIGSMNAMNGYGGNSMSIENTGNGIAAGGGMPYKTASERLKIVVDEKLGVKVAGLEEVTVGSPREVSIHFQLLFLRLVLMGINRYTRITVCGHC